MGSSNLEGKKFFGPNLKLGEQIDYNFTVGINSLPKISRITILINILIFLLLI